MEWIELGELIYKPISGEWGKEIVADKDENSVKVLRTTNFTNEGLLDYSDVVLRNINTEKVEIKKLNYGDIIVEKSGGTDNFPVGRVVYFDKVKEIYLCNNFTTIFRTKREGIKNKYLFYFLFYNYNKGGMIKYYNKTTGIQNLKVNFFIKDLKVPVPPMETQEKIVKVLDQSQALIDKRKEQIEALDQLIESIFYTMFGDPVRNEKGWKIERLKDITSKIGSGSTPRGGESSYKESGISLIRSMNVYDNKFKYDGLAYIDEEQAKLLSNVIVENNDILINITGASITRTTIVPKNILPARVNQHVSILRCNNQVAHIYLLHLLISKKYKQKIYYISTSSGATREALTKVNLENLEIPIPPISLQNEFAQKVETIEKQKELLNQSLELLEENYKSIMDRAFKGQLFN